MDELTENLPLLPLTSGVVLPGMVFTMALESDEAKAAAEAAEAAGGHFVIVPFIDGRYATVGVVAEVMETGELPGGMPAVAVRGIDRARLGTAVPGTGQALWVEVEHIPEPPVTDEATELAREYRAVVENILLGRGAGRLAERLADVTDPGRMADMSGYSPDLSLAQKVEVLETIDVEQRLRMVIAWAREVLADLTLRERIKTDVEEGMEKTQREFLLRRQLESIRKELGQLGGDDEGAPDDYRGRVEGADLPEGVRKAVDREIDKLERMSEQNPEHGWIRTWLDTVLELPWGEESDDRLDVVEASRILDEDHDGLRDVKDRILEHLAVRKLQAERGLAPVGGRGAGAILALVGPPGVGKTSLGESVARALGRSFVRVALGGVRDEAEIRGHRRTYVGAQPGRLVRALREAGTMNPVIVLDEVDKLGADYRGDPSSALLEVLDPLRTTRSATTTSRSSWICPRSCSSPPPTWSTPSPEPCSTGWRSSVSTATPRTRRWRSPATTWSGASSSGPRWAREEVVITDGALRAIVGDYTREAGVRSLERELGRLLRKVAARIAADGTESPLTVDADDVREWLGRPRFFFEAADRTAVPGVATGLAVTGTGGDVLYVEATMMDGPEGLTLTGQLGDVMKESAEIALSYVRSHAPELGIDPTVFAGKRFHVHVPAGAIPKDGPSAGVTMTTALVSLLRDVPVRSVLGMTGEVTLQGRVLPIGGVRQKVLAAHRAGLTDVVLPIRNGPDLEDVPDAVRQEMTFHLASDISEVLDAALSAETAATTGSSDSAADGRRVAA